MHPTHTYKINIVEVEIASEWSLARDLLGSFRLASGPNNYVTSKDVTQNQCQK